MVIVMLLLLLLMVMLMLLLLLMVMVMVMLMLLMLMLVVLCRCAPLATEDPLHEAASADVLDISQSGKTMDLFGLPAFFDAIVDESD